MHIVEIVIIVLGVMAAVMTIAVIAARPGSVYENEPEERNPLEGKKVKFVEDDEEPENAGGVHGHLEAIGDSLYNESFYERYIKRLLDIIISFFGIIILSPVFVVLSIWIYLDDPGPVIFTQKRVGQNKQYFRMHKFRSMRIDTPHNVPTHMLDNPEKYITKAGLYCRKHSLDEIVQIFDCLLGNLSLMGLRPALWNQDLLIAERDKYGANDVKPGITGWVQINGRDELEIPVKAKLDGEYYNNIGLKMDVKCFLGTIRVFCGDKSVVEGATGEIHKKGQSR